MKILILGDVMGPSGRTAINNKLPGIIKKYEADLVLMLLLLEIIFGIKKKLQIILIVKKDC